MTSIEVRQDFVNRGMQDPVFVTTRVGQPSQCRSVRPFAGAARVVRLTRDHAWDVNVVPTRSGPLELTVTDGFSKVRRKFVAKD